MCMIEVNGNIVNWEEGLTVSVLLNNMNYTFPMIVVRVNNIMINKEEWATYQVPDGAVVQARHLVAGG
ncbi:MAG TPA: sulfur carrier protein ThiS [Candidatus Limnocylindrales bacterium]|nr:sulfur carrier protein ThiS [Candidatus Limnocylindrales bacterium]